MRRQRRGSLLLEASMAVALLALVFMAVSQLLAVAGRQRREAQWRWQATLEAANVLERVMARPWDELTTDGLAALTLSAQTARRLPDPRLRVDTQPLPGPPAAKRIRVRLDWVNLAGDRGQPVVLVAWKHNIPRPG